MLELFQFIEKICIKNMGVQQSSTVFLKKPFLVFIIIYI